MNNKIFETLKTLKKNLLFTKNLKSMKIYLSTFVAEPNLGTSSYILSYKCPEKYYLKKSSRISRKTTNHNKSPLLIKFQFLIGILRKMESFLINILKVIS